MTHTVGHHDHDHAHHHGRDDDHDRDHHHHHDDDHGDDHNTGWLGRLRDRLSEMVSGHSHDASDQIDALELNAAGRRALLISLAGLGVTAVLQAGVVVVSGSVALLGDTLHNVA